MGSGTTTRTAAMRRSFGQALGWVSPSPERQVRSSRLKLVERRRERGEARVEFETERSTPARICTRNALVQVFACKPGFLSQKPGFQGRNRVEASGCSHRRLEPRNPTVLGSLRERPAHPGPLADLH